MTGPQARIRIQWTEAAIRCLRELPPKVRKGLLNKADELENCCDPRKVHKSLLGPLQGHYRITYGRYRAVYRVTEDRLANGDTLVQLTVLFVAAGKRQERSKEDVYKVAQKIVEYGLIDNPEIPRPAKYIDNDKDQKR